VVDFYISHKPILKAFFTSDYETSPPQIMKEWLICLPFFFLVIFVWIAAGVTCIGYFPYKGGDGVVTIL